MNLRNSWVLSTQNSDEQVTSYLYAFGHKHTRGRLLHNIYINVGVLCIQAATKYTFIDIRHPFLCVSAYFCAGGCARGCVRARETDRERKRERKRKFQTVWPYKCTGWLKNKYFTKYNSISFPYLMSAQSGNASYNNNSISQQLIIIAIF